MMGIPVRAIVLGAMLLIPLDAVATPIVSTDVGSLTVTAGTVYTVNVLIGANPGPADDAVNLYAYQLSVSYDPAFLSVQDPLNPATEGSFFTSVYSLPGQTSFISGFDDTLGDISFIADTLVGPLAGVSGNGTVASIQFLAVGDGATSVSAFFNTDNGDGLIAAEVTPVAVPEPATMLLVGAGSAIAAARRARRSARRS